MAIKSTTVFVLQHALSLKKFIVYTCIAAMITLVHTVTLFGLVS
jgi:hypothetical protein